MPSRPFVVVSFWQRGTMASSSSSSYFAMDDVEREVMVRGCVAAWLSDLSSVLSFVLPTPSGSEDLASRGGGGERVG